MACPIGKARCHRRRTASSMRRRRRARSVRALRSRSRDRRTRLPSGPRARTARRTRSYSVSSSPRRSRCWRDVKYQANVTTIATIGIAINAINFDRIDTQPRRTSLWIDQNLACSGPMNGRFLGYVAFRDRRQRCCRARWDAAMPRASRSSDRRRPPSPPSIAREDLNPRMLRRFRPLHPAPPRTREQVALGKMLYFDPRLSRTTISCNTCHRSIAAAPTTQSVSIGTTASAASATRDGVQRRDPDRAVLGWPRADLEHQATGPILDQMEMVEPQAVVAYDAATHSGLRRRVRSRVSRRADRSPACGACDRRVRAHARDTVALGSLPRGRSRRDSHHEQDGPEVVRRCRLRAVPLPASWSAPRCFRRSGIVDAWPNQTDQGRYEITHSKPIAWCSRCRACATSRATAPYFHDGSVATLRTAIAMMGKHQLGVELTPRRSRRRSRPG